MKKEKLQSAVEKYYLDGLVNIATWHIKDNKARVPLLSQVKKNLFGEVNFDFEVTDAEFVIHNTSKFIKIVKILDEDINIDFEKNAKTARKMKVSDSSYDLDYVLSDMFLAPKMPTIDEPEYDIEFDISKELIEKFIKAKKALGSDENINASVSISTLNGKHLNIELGTGSSYSDKLKFTSTASFSDETLLSMTVLSFPAEEVKLIFDNNQVEGKGYLSSEGLMKFTFNEDTCSSTYWLIANES